MALGDLPSGCISAKLKAAHSLRTLGTLCALVVLLGITCAAAYAANPEATAAKLQAQICGDAILHNDYEAFVSMIYPKAMLAMGGRNAVIKKFRQENQKHNDQGSSIQSVTMGDVTQIKQSNTEMFAVVPQTIEMAAKDGVLRSEGYLLGISSDNGKTWRFINGDEVAELGNRMRTLLPNLPADLQLPEPREPTVVSANTDAQASRQESDQGDSLEIRRSFYTAKVPKGSTIGLTGAKTDIDHGALVVLPNGNPLVIIVVDDRTMLRTAFNEILGSYRAKLKRTSVSSSDLFNGQGGRGTIVSGTTVQGVPYSFEAGIFRAKSKGFILVCGYPQARPDETRQILRQVISSIVVKE